MGKTHIFSITNRWTGNLGEGTIGYDQYLRDHEISVQGRPSIICSADPVYRGDGSKYNPEELFISAFSTCQMLWYFHLCADAGVIVLNYIDIPTGILDEGNGEGGKFIEITLKPTITIKEASMSEFALQLFEIAHHQCFMANSANFPVRLEPKIISL